MKKQRLNHKKLNEILLDPAKESDKRIYSDFQIYYIQEAAKAFMDIHCNDFINREGDSRSRFKINEKAVEILTEFDLFLDADPFYDLYQKSLTIKDFNHPAYDHSKELALESINEIEKHLSEPEDRKTIELKKIKERLSMTCKDLNIPVDEAVQYLASNLYLKS